MVHKLRTVAFCCVPSFPDAVFDRTDAVIDLKRSLEFRDKIGRCALTQDCNPSLGRPQLPLRPLV